MIGDELASDKVTPADVDLVCSLNAKGQLDAELPQLERAIAAGQQVGHAAILACLGSPEARSQSAAGADQPERSGSRDRAGVPASSPDRGRERASRADFGHHAHERLGGAGPGAGHAGEPAPVRSGQPGRAGEAVSARPVGGRADRHRRHPRALGLPGDGDPGAGTDAAPKPAQGLRPAPTWSTSCSGACRNSLPAPNPYNVRQFAGAPWRACGLRACTSQPNSPSWPWRPRPSLTTPTRTRRPCARSRSIPPTKRKSSSATCRATTSSSSSWWSAAVPTGSSRPAARACAATCCSSPGISTAAPSSIPIASTRGNTCRSRRWSAPRAASPARECSRS